MSEQIAQVNGDIRLFCFIVEREREKKKQKDNVNLGAGSKIFFDLLAIHKKHKNLVFITEIKMGAVSVVFYCQHFLWSLPRRDNLCFHPTIIIIMTSSPASYSSPEKIAQNVIFVILQTKFLTKRQGKVWKIL